MSTSRTAALYLSLCGLLLVSSYLHLNSGQLDVNQDLLDAAKLSHEKAQLIKLIFLEIRLPRLVLGLLVGFSLGASGAVMQGLLRNPLAGPDLLGMTNCAAFGAVLVLYFGVAYANWWLLPLGGISGAFIGLALIFLLAAKNRSTLSIILAGTAINAIAGSFISLALNFSNNPYAMSEIIYWLMGSLSNRSLQDVYTGLPFILIGCLLLFLSARFLDALSLGEDTAITLGFNIKREQTKILIATALAVGTGVALCGSIGFIGLVVPHLCRPLVQHQPSKLILCSGLMGACFVVLADIIVQRISVNQELKLGVVTAILGGPFFLYLIYHLQKQVR